MREKAQKKIERKDLNIEKAQYNLVSRVSAKLKGIQVAWFNSK